MSDAQLYVIRDARGNIYGPAGLATLRQWIQENRIAPDMEIAVEGTTQWQPAGAHPGLAGAWTSSQASPDGRAGAPSGTEPQSSVESTPDAFPTPGPSSAASANPYATAWTPGIDYALPVATSRWSIAALICGIVGLVPVCGTPFAVAAVVCGIVGMVNVHDQPQQLKGRGMGLAGLILGIIGLIGCCGCLSFSNMNDPIFPPPSAHPSAAPGPAPAPPSHRQPRLAPGGPPALPT